MELSAGERRELSQHRFAEFVACSWDLKFGSFQITDCQTGSEEIHEVSCSSSSVGHQCSIRLPVEQFTIVHQ